MRLLEEEEERNRELLRQALEAGEQSGLAVPYDGEGFRAKMMAKYVNSDVEG